ncbi:MAG: glycosyltransferase family 39 protein [Aridibacter famidurans]|nr:glycosyltransferase family 39 protein [Aridibacter famidurans]
MPIDQQNSETSQNGSLRFDIPWIVLSLLVTLVAAFLRFYWIDLKPLHHDEGVNGHFLTRLFRDGVYQYDPSNYHGPDLYYISLLFTKLFGLNTHSVRWSVAVFGVLTVVLALFLKRWIGRIGALSGALFLALSPGMVYISRYFIHEILFVFFSFSFVVAILYFIERKKAGVFATGWMALILMVCFLPPALQLPGMLVDGNSMQWAFSMGIFAIEAVLVFLVMRMLLLWDGGRPIYLFLASASLILLLATKETAFITIGTMVIAWVCVSIWQKITALEGFRSKRTGLLWIVQLGIPAAAALAIVSYFEELSEGYERLRDFFEYSKSGDQTWVFYGIIFLVLASALTWIIWLTAEQFGTKEEDAGEFDEPSFSRFRKAISSRIDLVLICVGCAFVFIYVGVLFFSSFFTYPGGVIGAFEAYAIWTKTGSRDHTQNGTFAYLRWMMETEAPILALAALGSLMAWIRAKHGVALFTGLWAFGLFAAYTIIPYKTPWLALSFILPMCIVGGYGIGRLLNSPDVLPKLLGGLLGAAAVVILAFQTYDMNFVRYDDDRMPYVYAHTTRGFEDLMTRVKQIAEASGKGRDMKVDVVSGDYWPMPWYLNDYPNTVYHGALTDSSDAEVIIAGKSQEADLGTRYGTTHDAVSEYPLRPGVDLILLVRKDVKGGR